MSEAIQARLPSRPAARAGRLIVEINAEDFDKLNAFWDSDLYEQAKAAREARLDECLSSAEVALNQALRESGSGAKVLANVLASLYNGYRVKFDVSDLLLLDAANFEHAINCMRLSFETRSEPHTWFQNGGELFERMIKAWGFEKKGGRK
ncbi:MAG: hypothetical protein H3C26_20225 [Rhodocyclaceae bacterium]|nr:hypothetical protein [Rhodocyclaceae bacterium]